MNSVRLIADGKSVEFSSASAQQVQALAEKSGIQKGTVISWAENGVKTTILRPFGQTTNFSLI